MRLYKLFHTPKDLLTSSLNAHVDQSGVKLRVQGLSIALAVIAGLLQCWIIDHVFVQCLSQDNQNIGGTHRRSWETWWTVARTWYNKATGTISIFDITYVTVGRDATKTEGGIIILNVYVVLIIQGNRKGKSSRSYPTFPPRIASVSTVQSIVLYRRWYPHFIIQSTPSLPNAAKAHPVNTKWACYRRNYFLDHIRPDASASWSQVMICNPRSIISCRRMRLLFLLDIANRGDIMPRVIVAKVRWSIDIMPCLWWRLFVLLTTRWIRILWLWLSLRWLEISLIDECWDVSKVRHLGPWAELFQWFVGHREWCRWC